MTASLPPGCILTDLIFPSALLEGDVLEELLVLLAVCLTHESGRLKARC